MTDKELCQTLRTASASVNENIALAMLLTMAAERIEKLNERISEMGWQINPERMGQ